MLSIHYSCCPLFSHWVYSLFSLSILLSDIAILLRYTNSLSTSVLYQSLRRKSYLYFVTLQLLIVSSISLICLSGISLSALPTTEVISLICLSIHLHVVDRLWVNRISLPVTLRSLSYQNLPHCGLLGQEFTVLSE
jgi:hypothetical protein